jgi:hypothetical protein
MMRITIASIVALGVLVAIATGPAYARSTSPKSYFCTKHPSAKQCLKPAKPPAMFPATGAGGTAPVAGTRSVVTGLSGSPAQPAQLPTTGGGAPVTPTGNNWLLLAAMTALVSGLGIRLAASRR